METLHFNGERWYVNRWPLWYRVLRWFVWFGGWERSRCTEGTIRYEFRIPWYADRKLWVGPWPVSLLGHRVTFYGHWMQARTRWGILVIDFRERYAYLSRDGTPNSAHAWLWGLRPQNVPGEAYAALTPDPASP